MHIYRSIQYLLFSLTLLSLTACGPTVTETDTNKLSSKSAYNSPLQKIFINEVLSANANTNYDPDFKEFSDWIELYNDSNETVTLSGYYLSDDEDHPTKWKIPQDVEIKAYDYLLIWADGKDIYKNALHSNFKLSQKGEYLSLANPHAEVIDHLNYPSQEGDISCAKVTNQIIYMSPTPAAPNAQLHYTLERSKKPSFSLNSGFYEGEQLIELEAGGDIYYTLDGSHPTTSSTLYNAPIMIDETTVIRAINVEEGKFSSYPYSQTYLIDENITLPVMSLSLDKEYLYSDEIGIYTNSNDDWSRAGNVEFIKNGQSQFTHNVNIKLHGAGSRIFPQKSFDISFKTKYGLSSMNYPLFLDKPHITNIKKFILRNSGNDWEFTMMRDALFHSIAKEIKLDYQAYEPIITFLNGKYYGILNIREKTDETYIVSNHAIAKNNINLIATKHGKNKVIQGSNNDYTELIRFVQNNSLSDEDNYNYIKNKIDIQNFVTYFAFEIYINNTDWPHNNIKFWKTRTSTSKWKWIVYDTDFGFGLAKWDNIESPSFNSLQHSTKGHSTTHILYTHLLKNETFRETYYQIFSSLLQTYFKPENIKQKITDIKQKIVPEITRHLNHWFGNQQSFSKWRHSINVMNAKRPIPPQTIKELEDCFSQEKSFHLWEKDVEKLYNYAEQRDRFVLEDLKAFFDK